MDKRKKRKRGPKEVLSETAQKMIFVKEMFQEILKQLSLKLDQISSNPELKKKKKRKKKKNE